MFMVVIVCFNILSSGMLLVEGVPASGRSWEKEACSKAKLRGQTRYTCSRGKKIVCNEGWIGDLCQVAVCGTDCSPTHGYCTQPGECTCNLGYTGSDCSVCMPLPGCKHGKCSKSFECKCEEGWSGSFCNVAECPDTCNPKHGSCTQPNVCTCNSGYKGENCTSCAEPEGCLHGTCTRPGECNCSEGWSGPLCDIAICAEGCQGTCSEPGECRCEVGWQGENCDVCVRYPGCANGDCKRPWQCNCQDGWSSQLCDVPTWETGWRGGVCTPLGSFLCMNGGTEICNYWGNGSLVEPPKCLCKAGYKGVWCDEIAPLTESSTNLQMNESSPTLVLLGTKNAIMSNSSSEMNTDTTVDPKERKIIRVRNKLENPLQWSGSRDRYIGSGRRTT